MHHILVSAYGCEPFAGSEAGVGWNWVLQMAKQNHLYVITRANNRDKIEANIPDDVKENLSFYYYDAPDIVKKLKRREKGLYVYYAFWQMGIIKVIREIIRNNTIDYTMHLSFGSFWMPTFLPCFQIPFIWGPLGGGDCVPKPFLSQLPVKDRMMQSMRYFLKASSFVNPLVAYPAKRAAAILARTEDSAATIPLKYRDKVSVVLETAMSDDIFDIRHTPHRDDTLRLIYTGRLTPTKNVMSLVKALHRIGDTIPFHLTIVGRGSEKQKISDYIGRAGLMNRVTLIDEVPRTEVLQLLSSADVYLFPSLHEGGSWALMEAMAIGLPVVCLDCTGMHTITSDDTAVRIMPTGELDLENGIADAIVRFYKEPDYRMGMGEAARERIISKFRWPEKGEFMEALLKELDRSLNRQ